MPDILPTIDNEPAQGIQALLDTVYLWNQDIANDLIDKINELIKELDDIVTDGEIKPYSELLAPVRQYIPMFYGNGIYVAAEEVETLPAEPDLSKWILIATRDSTLVAGDGIDIENDVVSVEQSVLQGAAAGATAVQPGDLAQVATTGNYNDLTNKPSLGTAAAADVSDFATAAQGAKADTAVQPGDLATVATTGAYSDLSGTPTIPTTLAELTGDVAISSPTEGQLLKYDFATHKWKNATQTISISFSELTGSPEDNAALKSALDEKADASSLATVATSGSYNDLKNKPMIPAAQVNSDWNANSGVAKILHKPTLGTAAAANTTDFATAAQGTKADTAVQPADMTSAISSHNMSVDAHTNVISPLASSVSGIEAKIPSQASSSNQLADKEFVNSSIATNTANFIGTFNSVAELEAYSGPVTNNDYAYVIRTDATGNTLYDRYKYTDATTPASWEYEYTLNNSSFTADQWAAINSHATAASISQISTNQQNISDIQTTIGSFGDIVTHDVNEFATASQGAKADTAVQPADLATVATSGSYTDLSNTPTLATVATSGSYNDLNDKPTLGTMASETAADYYTKTAADAAFATAAQGAKADTAVQPGDLATVATSGSYNDLSNKPTIPEVLQYSTMPTASASILGKIVQFTGVTDSEYTNGYFYKCVQVGQDSYSWILSHTQPEAPVFSVNHKVGFVELDAKDVGAIPQYSTLPTAGSDNVGDLVQYNGATVPDVPASATISQTTGSGLKELAVNVSTFEGVEQPSGAETVNFVCTGTSVDKLTGTNGGITVTITNPSLFISKIKEAEDRSISPFVFKEYWFVVAYHSGDPDWYECDLRLYDINNREHNFSIGSSYQDWGVSITAESGATENTWIFVIQGGHVLSSWTKNNVSVDLTDYGISYLDIPSSGDVLTVSYTPLVAGITNGYFYKSYAEYSDPTATISQTVGSGLTNLAVDVDTFIEAEQPTQSETVNFVANVTSDSVVFNVIQGNFTVSIPFSGLRQLFIDNGRDFDNDPSYRSGVFSFYLGGNQCGFGPSYGSDWIFIDDISTQAAQYGLVVTGEPTQGVDNYAEYVASSGTTSWKKGLETVSLDEYGISYSGNPDDGDTLAVAYTAPAVTGYHWNQVDVQPSSGGGNTGIDWKAKVDLPAEYAGSEWSSAAYFTIAGGLPDGEYEFYYSVKCTINSGYPVCERVYKIRIVLNNQGNTIFGQVGYVFDGGYMNNDNRANCLDTRILYNCMKRNGSDAIFYPNDWFGTDILAYNSHQAVAECFKLSTIKNVETGEEYVAIGEINLDGSGPQYTGEFYGEVQLVRLGQQPYMPDKTNYYSTPIYEFENKTIMTAFDTEYCTLTMEHPNSGSVFAVEYTGVRRGSRFVPYAQKISKSTGVFAGCYLAVSNNYVYVVGVDTATAATMSGNVNVALGVLSNNSASIWFEAIPQSTTPIAQTGPQGDRLGVITYDGLGNLVQYTGETNANYTNGYFYKATGTVVVIPSSISFTNIDPSDFVVTVSDPEDLITAMNNYGGWGEEWVRDRLAYDWTSFQIAYDADAGVVVSVWWSNFGTFSGQDVLDCFAVSTTGSYTGQVTITFTCDAGYTPQSKGVQNPAWIRVDVQPGGGGASYSAGTGIDITNNTISTDSSVIRNVSTQGGYSIAMGYNCAATGSDCCAMGTQCSAAYYSVAIGLGCYTSGQSGGTIGRSCRAVGSSTAMGVGCQSNATSSLAIGNQAYVNAAGAIQINSDASNGRVNGDADTVKIGTRTGNYEIMSADGTVPADRLTHAINKYSTMPTASASNEGWIVQFTGTTDATYTHGYIYECKAQGTDPETYAWEAVTVQASSGGLPSQTGNAGKFLTTDGTNASWADILTSTTATLAVADWSNGSQTVNVTGVTATNTIMVGAAPSSVAEYNTCGVLCTAQGAGTLTFTCASTPSNDLTVNVLIM